MALSIHEVACSLNILSISIVSLAININQSFLKIQGELCPNPGSAIIIANEMKQSRFS
jgi:hypothetical protein